MAELFWQFILPMLVLTVIVCVVMEHYFPSPSDEQIGFCPDGRVHNWRSEYCYDNAGGDYTRMVCGRCGA